MNFIQKHATRIALIGVVIFSALSLYTAATDSLTFDERAHIPAGYSYVRYGDIRLNPEHPPLLKDLAGLPLLFLQPQFPVDSPEWQNGPNEQWAIGSMFLSCTKPELACNNTFLLTFWSRLPLVLVSVLLALFLFWWTRETSGPLAGLLALGLMIGDPNILAHNHLVTTDVGIAAFLFFCFYFFLRFLKDPSWKNTWLFALFFTLVQLVKFSAVLLFPIFGLFVFLYALALPAKQLTERLRHLGKYIGRIILVFFFYALFVYAFYSLHVIGTPTSHFVDIAHLMFPERELGPIARAIVEYTSSVDFLKPYAAYLLGVLMVFGRVAGGNTHYFLGTVQGDAQMSYFPVVFLSKETLPFLFFFLFSIVYSGFRFVRNTLSPNSEVATSLPARFLRHIDTSLVLFFVIFYALLSIFGNLNIGFRHLFPILPFLYFWIAKTFFCFLRDPRVTETVKKMIGSLAGVLVCYQLFIPLLHFPYYLPYYNEIVGGTNKGYLIATDSNYDWGQDLGRLEKFIERHNACIESPDTTLDCTLYAANLPVIEKMRIDYFGGESAEHVLGPIFEGWWSERQPESGWYAISINTLQENWTTNSNPLTKKSDNNYLWLKEYEPVTRAGKSLFIYYIP